MEMNKGDEGTGYMATPLFYCSCFPCDPGDRSGLPLLHGNFNSLQLGSYCYSIIQHKDFHWATMPLVARIHLYIHSEIQGSSSFLLHIPKN